MRTREQMLEIKIADISKGLTCGAIDKNTGRRRQTRNGEWLYELVFLCDVDKDYTVRIWETTKGINNAWMKAILHLLKTRGFKYPVPTLYCYDCDLGMITSRKIDLEINIEEMNAPIK